MSLGKHDLVPVDTHIHSIAMNYYGQHNDNRNKQQLTSGNYDDISLFFEELWQPFAGWAQAVCLFLLFLFLLLIEFIQAVFSNALRLSTSPRNSTERSVPPLKRSSSSQEIVIEKIFKLSDEDDQSQAITKTMKHVGKLREKKIKPIEILPIVSTRPKRNIKPINRY